MWLNYTHVGQCVTLATHNMNFITCRKVTMEASVYINIDRSSGAIAAHVVVYMLTLY